MPKTVKGGPLRFLNIHFVTNFQKIERGPFGVFEKISRKKSLKAQKGGLIMRKKKKTFCFGTVVKKISATAWVRTRTLWVEKQASYH